MNKNALITGATGFIGYHLCDRLYEDGYRVFAFGRKDENKIKCHEFYTSNLRNIPWRELPKIDVCFHLASNEDIYSKNEADLFDTNAHAASNLFRNLSEGGCKRFVYSSSCSVYGNQTSPFEESLPAASGLSLYAKSKAAFEKFASSFSSRTGAICIGLRYTEVYGTHELHKKHKSLVNQVIYKIHKNESPKIFQDGEQKRDWVYVSDVVESNILASRYGSSDVFNIGSGDVLSYNQIIEAINKKMGKSISPLYADPPASEYFQSDASVSLDKARSKLKYVPRYKFEDGLQELKVKLRKLF